MSAIVVSCPSTGSLVVTGQHATQPQFDSVEFSGRFRCTACGQVHAWSKSEAHLVAPRARAPV